MVLEAFIGPCPKNMECRHLDGNSHNNNLENLCWGTHEEQSKDRERHGTTNAGKFINVGDKAPMAKLTEAKVKIIKQFLRAKNYKQWQIAEMFNISESAINMIHRKKTWWYVD
jgi:hypothetical protein